MPPQYSSEIVTYMPESASRIPLAPVISLFCSNAWRSLEPRIRYFRLAASRAAPVDLQCWFPAPLKSRGPRTSGRMARTHATLNAYSDTLRAHHRRTMRALLRVHQNVYGRNRQHTRLKVPMNYESVIACVSCAPASLSKTLLLPNSFTTPDPSWFNTNLRIYSLLVSAPPQLRTVPQDAKPVRQGNHHWDLVL